MVRFEALRAAAKKVRERAAQFVDDERAERIERTFSMLEQTLVHLEAARTPSRLASRCPAARRVFDRLAAELACDGAEGWAELTAPVLAALERTGAACAEAEETSRAASERIVAGLRAAAAA